MVLRFSGAGVGWPWYRDNGLTIREVVDTLREIKTGVAEDEEKVTKLTRIGLLSAEKTLTSQGSSLIESQTASERKYLSFEGRILSDA